jgi:G:T-mismatch repair DNA endonuclease (very short patch repair protein)
MCSLAGVSKVQLEWLKYIETTSGDDIIYKGGKHNREEKFHFNSKLYRVDGCCKETKTIYEFLGCWYHGCPDCPDPEKIHCWLEKPLKELLQEFVDRKKLFEENGYTVVSIWECQWKKYKKIKNI